MRSNYIQFVSPQFSLLSEGQLDEIHMATLELLRHTGVRFHHERALEILRKAGVFISDGNLVKFPARLIEEAIKSSPRRIALCDRHGQATVKLEANRVYFGTGSDCPNMIDPTTGERRSWTTEDLCNTYKLCDALPNIAFQMSAGVPTDVPEGISMCRWQYLHMFQHTTKPIVFVCNDLADATAIIEMAAAVVGDKEELRRAPLILLYSEPSSPLQQSTTAIDKLLLVAENEIPVVHSPAPMLGATSPIMIAGGLVMANAEVLSSLTLHQLKQPGAPFVFGSGLQHMDMQSTQTVYASPEFDLAQAAVAQLAKYYDIPSWGYAGCTDAKVLDEQAGAEATMSIMMAQFAGINLVHDIGYMESGLTTCMELIVLCNELINMTTPLIKGIDVTDESLSLDVLHKVGPGGNFLTEPQTLEHYRDFWYPQLMDRQRFEAWQAGGSLSLKQKVSAMLKDILTNHQPEPLPKDKIEKLMHLSKSC